MKILTPLERLYTPQVLIVLNVAIILATEFIGGGRFFAESGLAYGIAILFAALIMVRIFSDYAYSDYILKGFLKIQFTFLVLLGLVQFYEYAALHVFMIRPDVVQLTVVASYFVWILSTFLALGFVFRIYYKQSPLILALLWAFFGVCVAGLIAPNISPAVVAWFPTWFPNLILVGIVVSGIAGMFAITKLTEVMPVFREYAYYAVAATILLMMTGFSEYFEATGILRAFGISDVQNVYISHFLVYAALSFLLVGFGKLKKPTGIYAEL